MKFRRPRFKVIRHLGLLGLVISGLISKVHADDPALPLELTVEQPVVVVTAASIDRMLERGTLCSELAGNRVTKDQLLAAILRQAGNPELAGIDLSKPVGMMFLYRADPSGKPSFDKQDEADKDDQKPGEVKGEIQDQQDQVATEAPNAKGPPGEDLDLPTMAGFMIADYCLSGIHLMFGEPIDGALDFDRWVFFVPISDLDQALKSLDLSSIADHPDRYADANGGKGCYRRIGNYLVFGSDAASIEHCPDPTAVTSTLASRHDLAVSFRTKGLPVEVRAARAESLKREFAASLEKTSDESEKLHALRRAAGNLVAELLDLALSHVDEVSIMLDVDTKLRQIVTELDVVGAENGKFSQFVHEWTPKRSPLQPLWQEDGPLSASLSLAIPPRHGKPIALALMEFANDVEGFGEMVLFVQLYPLLSGALKLLDSGDFDVLLTGNVSGGTWHPLLGLSVPAGPGFPDQFQAMLNLFRSLMEIDAENFEVDKDVVKGIPVHLFSWKELDEGLELFTGTINEGGNKFWVTATSNAVFLALGGASQIVIPDLLNVAIHQTSSDSKTSKPADVAGRDASLFRMTVHKAHWITNPSPTDNSGKVEPQVEQVQFTDANRDTKLAENIRTAFRKGRDGVYAEVQPITTGLRLTARFDDAFLAVCGHLLNYGLGDNDDK